MSPSSSVDCRAGDYELPPATTVLCQFRQLARANHVVCVSQKVLNVSEKQGSLPSWFSLPMELILGSWTLKNFPVELWSFARCLKKMNAYDTVVGVQFNGVVSPTVAQLLSITKATQRLHCLIVSHLPVCYQAWYCQIQLSNL